MTTRYSSDYKSLVTRLLWMYGGNVSLVSHLTGIPQRTLRDWRWQAPFPAAIRREDMSERREHETPPPEINSGAAAADEMDTLRQHLMQQALNLVASLPGEIEHAPLSERVMALTRLIDRIVKIDDHNPVEVEEIMRSAYEDEDWADDDDEDNWDADVQTPALAHLPEAIGEP